MNQPPAPAPAPDREAEHRWWTQTSSSRVELILTSGESLVVTVRDRDDVCLTVQAHDDAPLYLVYLHAVALVRPSTSSADEQSESRRDYQAPASEPPAPSRRFGLPADAPVPKKW